MEERSFARWKYFSVAGVQIFRSRRRTSWCSISPENGLRCVSSYQKTVCGAFRPTRKRFAVRSVSPENGLWCVPSHHKTVCGAFLLTRERFAVRSVPSEKRFAMRSATTNYLHTVRVHSPSLNSRRSRARCVRYSVYENGPCDRFAVHFVPPENGLRCVPSYQKRCAFRPRERFAVRGMVCAFSVPKFSPIARAVCALSGV